MAPLLRGDAWPGQGLWQDTVDLDGLYDEAADVAASEHGTFVVGMGKRADHTLDMIVRAYDPQTGALRWSDVYDRAASNEFGRAIAVDGPRVFASGFCSAANGNRDICVRAYDARTGRVAWTGTFDYAGLDDEPRFRGLAVAQGRVFVAGEATRGANDTDFVLVAFDAATGRKLWHSAADRGPADLAESVVADGGRVFATGTYWLGDGFHYVVRAHDPAAGASSPAAAPGRAPTGWCAGSTGRPGSCSGRTRATSAAATG